MSSITRSVQFLTFSVLLVAFGCASNSSAPPIEPTAGTPATVGQPDHSNTIASKPSSPTPLIPVYFTTDSATLSADARDALKTHAASIVEHPEWGILSIDGHCDERGSAPYNLALGKQRATAVARTLVEYGVSSSRLTTRTFGEARPASQGHHESAWNMNRRSELQFETLTSANR